MPGFRHRAIQISAPSPDLCRLHHVAVVYPKACTAAAVVILFEIIAADTLLTSAPTFTEDVPAGLILGPCCFAGAGPSTDAHSTLVTNIRVAVNSAQHADISTVRPSSSSGLRRKGEKIEG